MPRREFFLEIDLYMTEVKDIAEAAGAKVVPDQHTLEGWEFASLSDADKTVKFIRDVVLREARGTRR